MFGGQPENIKLILAEGGVVLEEGKTLADGQAESESVLHMVFKKPGVCPRIVVAMAVGIGSGG